MEAEHLEDEYVSFSNFVARLRPKQTTNAVYLYAFLRFLNNVGVTESMQSQTNGIRNLRMDEYLDQEIPFPPPEIQAHIAEEITTRRKEAEQYREQARILWG